MTAWAARPARAALPGRARAPQPGARAPRPVPCAADHGATVAAFVVAEAAGLSDRRRWSPPDRAAGGAGHAGEHAGQRRAAGAAVVLGVVLAVGFVSVVGLNWWSLGVLVAASIIGGQILRLGPHLLEVPISAMLVLGVGYAAGGRDDRARPDHRDRSSGRRSACSSTSRSRGGADPFRGTCGGEVRREIADLLVEAAATWPQAPSSPTTRALARERAAARPPRTAGRPGAGAKRREPQAATCAHRPPKVERSLREGLEALEHSSVSLRPLFRSCSTAPATDQPDAGLRRAGAAPRRAAQRDGPVVRRSRPDPGRTRSPHARRGRAHRSSGHAAPPRGADRGLLLDDPRSRVGCGTRLVLLRSTDRMLAELDVVEHARLRESSARPSGPGCARTPRWSGSATRRQPRRRARDTRTRS